MEKIKCVFKLREVTLQYTSSLREFLPHLYNIYRVESIHLGINEVRFIVRNAYIDCLGSVTNMVIALTLEPYQKQVSTFRDRIPGYINNECTTNIVDHKFNLIFKEGNFHDSSMSFPISGQNVNSSDYLFPFSNMNLIVDEKATLELSESNAKYSILPNSSLTIEGNLNLENNVKIVVLDSSQNYYESIINLVEKCSEDYDLNLYKYLREHQIAEQFIIESGTLNISENSAIYASAIQNNNGKINNQSSISDDYKYVVPIKYGGLFGFGADWGYVNLPIFK